MNSLKMILNLNGSTMVIKSSYFEVEAYNMLIKYEYKFMKVSFDLETMKNLIFNFVQVDKFCPNNNFQKDVLKFKKVEILLIIMIMMTKRGNILNRISNRKKIAKKILMKSSTKLR
jgi:hypothetical protein